MPITIPPVMQALRPQTPTTKPLTVAQQRALRQPQVIPTLSPEVQAQVQQQQQVISKLDVDIQNAKAELQQVQTAWAQKKGIKHSTMISAYNERVSRAQAVVRSLERSKNLAQKFVVTYAQASGYAGELQERQRWEEQAQVGRLKAKQKFEATYGVPYTRQTALRLEREALETYEQVRAQYEQQVRISKQQVIARPGEPGSLGYASEALIKLRKEISEKYPKQKGETQYEYSVRLGEETEWTKEAGKIVAGERKELGLLPLLPKPKLTEVERFQLAEKARIKLESPVVRFMRETPTPLEYVSGKIVKYDIPFFPTPQLFGFGIAGMELKRPSEVAPELWRARQEGEKVIETLERAQERISLGIRPIYKEEKVTLDKELSKYTLEIEKHNKEIKELEQEIKEYEKNPTELKQKELMQKGEKLDEEATLLEKDYERIESLREFFESEKKKVPKIVRVAQSVWVGFLGAPVGLVTLGLGLALRPEEEIVKQVRGVWGLPKAFIERPIEVGFGIAGQLAFFGLTGYGIARVRAVRVQPKITVAIKTGKVKVKTTGVLTESQIAKLKISSELKTELQGVLKRGGSIKKYKTWMEYPQKTKYTPDVKAIYYEVMGSEGRLIRRISFGELKATLKGKTIDRVSIADAIEMLNKKTGAIEGLMEVVVTKEPVVGYDLITGKMKIKYPKAKKYRFYEEIKPIKELRRPKKFVTLSEATHELLGTKKYKGEPLLKEYGITKEGILVYPEYRYFKGTGKPYTRGVFIEFGKLKKVRVDLWETGRVDYFMKSTKQWDTFGRGAVEFVKEPITKVKIKGMRGFTDEPLPDVIVKYPKPKPFKEPPTIPIQKVSQWYGKQVLVPEIFAPEVVTAAFTGELASAFTSGISWTGAGRGIGLGLGTILRPEVRIKPRVEIREELITPTKLRLEIDQLLVQKPKIEEQPVIIQRIIMQQRMLVGQGLLLGQTQLQKLRQKQLQKQLQIQKLVAPPVSPIVPVPPIIPMTFFFPGEKPKYVKEIPYDSFALIDATKERKRFWKKLNVQPLTKKSARDLGAEYIDKEISSKSRIAPQKPKIVKGKKVQPKKRALDLKSNYFEINRHKFRDWKQRKGKRYKTPNQIIELQRFRSDKIGEKVALQRGRGRRTPFGF